MPHTIRSDCRLCGDELSESLLDLRETPLANVYPKTPDEPLAEYLLYLVQCLGCGHVQLPMVVDAEELFPADYPYQSATTETFRKHLRGFAEDVSSRIGGKGRVLEIGSNDGTLLKEFQRLGHDVLGVDPAAELGAQARDAGVPTITSMYPTEALGAERFGAVVALNVLAHIDDLEGVLADAFPRLNGGPLVFEVGYWPEVLARHNIGVVYHEHMSYHSLGPLRRFLRRFDLNLFDAKRVDSQQGSIRVYADHSQRPMTKRLRDLLYKESRTDLSPKRLKSATYRAFHLTVRLNALRSNGLCICGYGAPAKLTTLVSLAGLTSEHIDCVFDDNPRKIGRYTPAGRIPIVSSVELMERRPDVILLFSGNFADEIKARFPEYKGQWWTI